MRLAGETYSNGGRERTEVAKYGESASVRVCALGVCGVGEEEGELGQ